MTTLRYVAIGDSLSEGVGDDPWPDGTPRGWTDRLAARLRRHHHGALAYANLAVRGDKAVDVRDRQLDAAIALAPDIVTVTAGMNDILRPRVDFEALASTMIELVAPFAASNAKVLVVPVPDVTGVSPVGALLNPRRVRLNDIYRRLCEEHGVLPLVGTDGTVFGDRRAWADDRLHLSALGHERLAAAAADALGLPVEQDYTAPPPGAAAARTVRTEMDWWWRHVSPWLGRRIRGRSSGDGHTAKRPLLTLVEPPDC